MLLVPIVAACAIAQPRILGLAIDEYMLKGDLDGLGMAALLFLAVVVLEYILGATQLYLMMVVGTRAVGTMRRDVYKHVMAQGQTFFDRRASGSLLSRTTTDIEAVGESIFQGVIGLIGDAFRLVGMISYMLALDWKLTLVGFGMLPVAMFVVNVFRKQLRDLSLRVRVLVARLDGFMQEHLAGVEVVQLMGREERATEEFAQINRSALKSFHWSNFYDSALYAVMDGVSGICIAAVIWYGGAQVMAGRLTPGMLVAFVEYIQKALVPIKEFSGRYATMQRSFAALQRIFGLLDTHLEPTVGNRAIDTPTGSIRFDALSFSYPKAEKQVLHEVSFDVLPGKVVALVGSTGSGKSTVCRLVHRAYDGYLGSLTVDGVEVRELDAATMRRAVTVVHQDVFLFRGSVAFNLGLGDPAVTLEKMYSALEWVQARELIDQLPQGLDTDVGDRGRNLSAGQGQLISFARALCRDSATVLLDEATASIDPATEGLIQGAIERILELKTVIVVAHRLSTIRAADEIIVLEQGRIVERGPHDELLAHGKRYAELYEQRQHNS
jgi:ATP-binding cassette subfamily B protein